MSQDKYDIVVVDADGEKKQESVVVGAESKASGTKPAQKGGAIVSYSSQPTAKMRKVSSQRPKYKPQTMSAAKIYLDRKIDADFHIDSDVWAFLMMECQENLSKEIGGFAYYQTNEDGVKEIVWACIASVGSGGHVATSADDVEFANKECLEEWNDIPNIQLHTHPSFNVYFSQVDINDIVDTIDTLQAYNPSGRYTFMVYNRTSAVIRVVEWSDKGLFYNDGALIIAGVKLDTGTSPNTGINYSPGKPKTGTVYQGSYGGSHVHQGSFNDDWNAEWQNWQPSTKATPAPKQTAKPKKPELDSKGALNYNYFALYSAANRIRSAVNSAKPFSSIIADLGYYEIRGLRAYYEESGETNLFQALQDELVKERPDNDASDKALKEIKRYMTNADGIESMIWMIQYLPWRVAEDVLADLVAEPSTRDLGLILDSEDKGICPPLIQFRYLENAFSGHDKEAIGKANSSLLSSIPKGAVEFWNAWVAGYKSIREEMVSGKA